MPAFPRFSFAGWVHTGTGRVYIALLTTRGRNSGQKRTHPVAYLPDGNRLILAASNAIQGWLNR